ncbi:far upstream element-binding protein 1-like [Impatiens glandulifera]|uniref:far upstream element-binding protein 1-like n=1 Tax=Impatiens glandulifera TaxID=253017 RepID=UPI001FB13DCA|nr:far upstream element-binding protein 1-like [Impatiens glandulifera]
MMDQRQNSTVTQESNKRKLEEDIQLAKQRAQEIAARLSIDAESKRPRLFSDDNNGFSNPSNPSPTPIPSTAQTFTSQFSSSIPPASVQSGTVYGLQGSSKTIAIPNGKVGMVIGKGGETIRYIQLQSGAKIQITRDSDADPYATTRNVELLGTQQQIERAEELIINIIKESDQGNTAQSDPKVQPGNEQIELKVPNHKVASLIGKGGETIRSIQSQSGARIQIIPLHLPPGDTSTERNVYISGLKEQVESARSLINDIISVNRPRQGGYMQQQPTYPPPQSTWAPPGQQPPPQQQQPGYGYPPPPPYYSNYSAPPPADSTQSATSAAPTPPYYGGYPAQEQSGSTTQQQLPSSYYGAYPAQTSDQSVASSVAPPPYYYGQSAEMGNTQHNLTSYGYGYGYPPPPPVPGQTYEQDPSKQTSQSDDQKKSDSKLDGTVEQSDKPQQQQQQVYPYGYGTAGMYYASGYGQMGYGHPGYPAQQAPPGAYPPPPHTEAYGGSEGNGAPPANGADTKPVIETTKG